MVAADIVKGRKCTAFPPVRPVLVAAGAHWVEPESSSATLVDGNLITAATYYGYPEFIRHIVKALGGNISGSNKRILFLCGVCLLISYKTSFLQMRKDKSKLHNRQYK